MILTTPAGQSERQRVTDLRTLLANKPGTRLLAIIKGWLPHEVEQRLAEVAAKSAPTGAERAALAERGRE